MQTEAWVKQSTGISDVECAANRARTGEECAVLGEGIETGRLQHRVACASEGVIPKLVGHEHDPDVSGRSRADLQVAPFVDMVLLAIG